ncbi:hypothetical protein [Roseomonas sp. 18066]|uniref:hypothetical protein n=1 Tax=Roseomonas sp. 18066 TaxID=2681412 RepID=UPI0013594AEF|nr:hypothetical protein [Roseomonas sp. 18066]
MKRPHDLSQAVLMHDVAVALVEAIEGLILQSRLPLGASSRLLDNALLGLPHETQVMIRFEAHRLWGRVEPAGP